MYKLVTYLGIYKTLSATTNPTVTTKLLAGKNGTAKSKHPSARGTCRWH